MLYYPQASSSWGSGLAATPPGGNRGGRLKLLGHWPRAFERSRDRSRLHLLDGVLRQTLRRVPSVRRRIFLARVAEQPAPAPSRVVHLPSSEPRPQGRAPASRPSVPHRRRPESDPTEGLRVVKASFGPRGDKRVLADHPVFRTPRNNFHLDLSNCTLQGLGYHTYFSSSLRTRLSEAVRSVVEFASGIRTIPESRSKARFRFPLHKAHSQ